MSVLTFAADAPADPALPVEVRTPELALVATTTLGEQLTLEPGLYFVRSVLPDGDELTATVEIHGGAPQQATLEADTDRLAAQEHARERETQRQEWQARSAGEADTVRAREGNLLTGEAGDAGTEASLVVSNGVLTVTTGSWTPRPIYVDVTHRDGSTRTYAAPIDANFGVTVNLDGDPAEDVVRLGHPQADLLCRYGERGLPREASLVSGSLTGDAEALLQSKGVSPVAAAVGGYALLRFSALERLHDWTENLRNWFAWLPDGAALRGEHLARLGRHPEAIDAFLEVHERGLPLFSDGVGYVVGRLELYVRAGGSALPESKLYKAQLLLDAIRPFASTTDFSQPITTFTAPPG